MYSNAFISFYIFYTETRISLAVQHVVVIVISNIPCSISQHLIFGSRSPSFKCKGFPYSGENSLFLIISLILSASDCLTLIQRAANAASMPSTRENIVMWYIIPANARAKPRLGAVFARAIAITVEKTDNSKERAPATRVFVAGFEY